MTTESEVRKIISDYRQLTDQLERLLDETPWTSPTSTTTLEYPVFDPDIDEPEEHPNVDGSRIQRDWCALMLWAQLRALNVKLGRGATREEVVDIAKSAGYHDGRGWNRWTGWEEREDGRWVTEVGMGHLRVYYEKVERSLPTYLT